MDLDGYLGFLCGIEGILRAEPLSADRIQRIAETEASVREVSGGMRLENIGLFQCIHRQDVLVVFCDSRFPRPDEVTMRMIDTNGVVIGHDVPPSMEGDLHDRDDLIWVSEGFVMYPGLISDRDAKFVMSSAGFPQGCVDGIDPIVYYPSVPTAQVLNESFGVSDTGISTLILGVDGVGMR